MLTFPGEVTGGLTQGTIELAFKWTGVWVDNNPHIIDQFLPPSASNIGLFLKQGDDSQWRLNVAINRQYGAAGATPIQANRWYRVAFSWDGQKSRLYLDGVLEAEVALNVVPETTTNPLLFGYNAGGAGGTSQFLGWVDEIRISDVARTFPPECSALATSPLRGFWAFDEGACVIAQDLSGGGHDGTIVAGAWILGKFGGGLQFTGDGGVKVCSSLPFDITGKAITLEAWVKPSVAAQGKCNMIMSKGREVGSTGGFQLAYDWGGLDPAGQPQPRIYGGVYLDGSPNVTAIFHNIQLPVDRFSHVAYTYDGSMMRLYLDGVEVANGAHAGTMTSDSE
jgi:hypothetical protein